jgi:uncharacterized protein (TIGR02246 family)
MGKDDEIVRQFFAAMQGGATAESKMASLFAEDAEYVEPFSGRSRTHRGRDAILAAMRAGWEKPLPNMRIEVDHVAITGDVVTARWTCHSPAIPGGKGQGQNVFTLRDGLIVRLETTLSSRPR